MPEVLDVVATREAIPEHGLLAGTVGTIVEILGDGHFEVEFSGDDGATYAQLALPTDSLIVLHYSPAAA